MQEIHLWNVVFCDQTIPWNKPVIHLMDNFPIHNCWCLMVKSWISYIVGDIPLSPLYYRSNHVESSCWLSISVYIPWYVNYIFLPSLGKSHEYPIKSHQHPMVSVLLSRLCTPNPQSRLSFFQYKPSIFVVPPLMETFIFLVFPWFSLG